MPRIFSKMSLAPAYTARETLDKAVRFHVQGLNDEAERHYREFLEVLPDHPKAVQFLGVLVFQGDRRAEGLALLERAVELGPNDAEAWSNLGNAYRTMDRIDEAEAALKRAVQLDPLFAPAHCTLSTCLRRPGTLGPSIDSARLAVQLDPSMPQAHSNLGYSLLESGDADGAVNAFRQALYLAPRFSEALQGLVFALHYSGSATSASIKSTADGFRSIFCPAPAAVPTRDAELIALVSPDLRAHPVAYFLEPLLQHWDHRRHRVVLIATSAQQDAWTERLRGLADEWIDACDKKPEELSEICRSAGIDVALDLAGHTAGSSAAAFASRLAPLQVSYLGYSGTTGIPAMDALVADPVLVCDGEERDYSERVLRLPGCAFSFDPGRISSPVLRSPARSNGHVTFGSFNNLSKISDGALSAWAALLAKVPGSRLVLKSVHLGESRFADRVLLKLATFGIERSRVEIRGWTTDGDPFADYGMIDIALDTFPYTGATTTVESLHMGVPVVSLKGDRYASRMSASILHAIGRDEWVADSVEEYIEVAVKLAADLEGLAEIRSGLRGSVASSTLCDGAASAKSLQDALDFLWEQARTSR